MLGGVIAAGRDLTGDGKPDFALGSTTANDDRGAVYVFFSDDMSPAAGGTAPFPAPPLWDLFNSTRSEGVRAIASADRHFELTVDASSAGYDFAKAVTLVPDLETDGGVGGSLADPDNSAELLIGMPAASGMTDSRAYLVHGANMVGILAGGSDVLTVPQSSSIITFMGDTTAADGFGSALAAGDVDADAYGDILICAPDTADGGRGYLFKGSSSSGVADAVFVAATPTDHFCSSAVLPGNADGFGGPDILIGARSGAGTGSGVGRAYLFQNPQ
jgi:hypothetical protein